MRIEGVNPGEHPEYIVVGLGNPGSRYEETRHNIGFKFVDYLDKEADLGRGIKRALHYSLTDNVVLDGYIVYLVKPQTYMNNSGSAVKDVLNYYKMSPEQLIVVYDDISLPVGNFRIRKTGSAGGHNGMKSIIEHLGTKDFVRIRIGVGNKPEQWDLADYVLSRFPENESKVINANFEYIKNAISHMFQFGIDRTMAIYNSVGSNNGK